jgi:hypothetical protein
MMLAISGPEFGEAHSDLRAFVLDRERRSLPARYQFYLVLYRGPLIRSIGGSVRVDMATGESTFICEVAHPPFAYAMTVDATPGALDAGNITAFGEVGYHEEAEVVMDVLVGFGHTPYPLDYRTKAALEKDRASQV